MASPPKDISEQMSGQMEHISVVVIMLVAPTKISNGV